MEHEYISGKEIPFFDTAISALIESDGFGGGGKPMDVGIENERGELYLRVRCWGLGEYMRFVQGVLSLGFKDLLQDLPSQRGLDSRFAVTEEVLKRKSVPVPDVPTLLEDIKDADESIARLPETERSAIIKSRLGQGVFRQQLVEYWQGCSVTGAGFRPMLRASHIKPWRVSTNEERLDQFNGLLLSPTLDAAFDTGLITFDEEGLIVISVQLSGQPAREFRITPDMHIDRKLLRPAHAVYLAYHREHVYVGSIDAHGSAVTALR